MHRAWAEAWCLDAFYWMLVLLWLTILNSMAPTYSAVSAQLFVLDTEHIYKQASGQLNKPVRTAYYAVHVMFLQVLNVCNRHTATEAAQLFMHAKVC
jgi:hypothetical protein